MADKTFSGKTCIGSVYRSVEDVMHVLQKPEFHSLPEVQELISIYSSMCEKAKKTYQLDAVKDCKNFPFIVLEGLDGSGKTTVTKKLSKSLSAEHRQTPPDCLLGLRIKFDKHPVELRKAYYSLGNYIAAEDVKMLHGHQSVVMDRFWHSTAAYTIAHEVREGRGNSQLPEVGDAIYNWPSDLLKPDLVLFLNVSEEVRNLRLSRRTTSTLEENKLKEDRVFRENLVEAYRRMRNPGIVEIDSNRTIKCVLAQIKTTIDHFTGK